MEEVQPKRCYYEIMGLENTCNQDQIKRVFKKLSLKYHPDKNRKDPEAAKKAFQEITEAYNCLSDEKERRWYDNNREKLLMNKKDMTREELELQVLNKFQEEYQEIKTKLKLAKTQEREQKIEKYSLRKVAMKNLINYAEQIMEEQQNNNNNNIEEEELSLEDQLEILQEKLKLAKKQEKQNKITKYESQIQEIESKIEQTQTKEKPTKKRKTSNQSQISQQQENEKIEEEEEGKTEFDTQNNDISDSQRKEVNEIDSKIAEIKEKIASKESKLEELEEGTKKYLKISDKIQALKDEKKQLRKQKKEINQKFLTEQQNTNAEKWQMQNDGSFKYQGSGNTNNDVEGGITIVLFYQYIEPQWTYSRFKEALNYAQTVGKSLGLGGRLRVAYEGFNGTISGTYKNVRQFCEELRKWEPEHFKDTLFKYIDGNPKGTHFPNLKVFEVKELVNYGLDGDQPEIKTYGGVHLPPKEYHKKMEEPNSVIIDVRNTYESIIGRFQPPDEKKCEFFDPQWRKSTELPEWLRKEETLQKLRGKNVLMYCTGGVRCERASAYIKREIGDQVNGIFQLEGGIEQYMKEFPDGGYWKGKNYTFDKRFAFGAYNKDYKEDDVLSYCSGCRKPWDRYRGKKRCSACLVPIIVCKECQENKTDKQRQLRCTLCEEQGVLPKIKRVPVQNVIQGNQQPVQPMPNPDKVTRLFVGNLPYESNEESIRSLFRPAKIKNIQWLKDKQTQKFYGSVFIDTETPECAGYCLAVNGRKLKGREVRVKFEKRKNSEQIE